MCVRTIMRYVCSGTFTAWQRRMEEDRWMYCHVRVHTCSGPRWSKQDRVMFVSGGVD